MNFNSSSSNKPKNHEFICKFNNCNKYFKLPIFLPCGVSICQEHVLELMKLRCQFCGDEHSMLNSGMKLNRTLQHVLDAKKHLNDEQKRAAISVDKLEGLINELIQMKKYPDFFLHNFMTRIEARISDEKKRLISDIERIASELMTRLDKFRTECMENLKKQDDLLYDDYDTLAMTNLYEFKQELRDPASDSNQILVESIKCFEVNSRKLRSLQNALLLRKSCSFEPKKFNFTENLFGFFNLNEINQNLLEKSSGYCITSLEGHLGQITSVKYSSELNYVASGSTDGTIKIWSLKNNGQCINTLKNHRDCVRCLLLIEEKILVSGSWDQSIKLWDLTNQICFKTFNSQEAVFCLCLLKKYNYLYSGIENGYIEVWDLTSLKYVRTLFGHSSAVLCLKLTRDDRLISGSFDRTIKIWEAANANESHLTLHGHEEPIYCLELTSNNKLLSGSHDKTIKIWDVDIGICLYTILVNEKIFDIKLLVDNEADTNENLLLIGSDSCHENIVVYDLDKHVKVKTLCGHLSHVNGFEIVASENGSRKLISFSGDKSIKIWSI